MGLIFTNSYLQITIYINIFIVIKVRINSEADRKLIQTRYERIVRVEVKIYIFLSWLWLVSFTLRRLYPGERTRQPTCFGSWLGPAVD
jgi:hypothetical protein